MSSPPWCLQFQVGYLRGHRILATSTKTLEIQKRGVKKYLPEVRREIEVRREMWMVEYVVQIFCAAAASLGCARPKGGGRLVLIPLIARTLFLQH